MADGDEDREETLLFKPTGDTLLTYEKEELQYRFHVAKKDNAIGQIVGGSDLADVTDHGLVAEVDTVVGADRDHGSLAGPSGLGQIGDDTHSGDATRRPVSAPERCQRAGEDDRLAA